MRVSKQRILRRTVFQLKPANKSVYWRNPNFDYSRLKKSGVLMTDRLNKATTIPGNAGSDRKDDPEKQGSGRDPEERPTNCTKDVREKMLDKTLADSFPSSDPLSTIPDPCEDDSMAA